MKKTPKFGIEIPKTVKEASELDKNNGDTKWMERKGRIDVICHSIFGCLHRVALFEIRELLPSSGSMLPPNTNFPTFC